jgi:hypothetical protein
MPVRDEIPLQGELNCWTHDFDVPDILLTVCATGATGMLQFSNAEAEKTLFVREGAIIFAKSSSVDDRMGEYLLRIGKVSLEDWAELSRLVKPGKRLGALMVENGVLDPKGLVQAVVGQVRSIVSSLFHWTEAQYCFTNEELPSKETITLDMPIARLIVEGVQEIHSWRRISRGIGTPESVYRTISGHETSVRKLDLDTPALELLAMLSRPRSVVEVCTESQLSDIDVCQFLWAFRSLGWIVPVEEDVSSDALPPVSSEDAGESDETVMIPAEKVSSDAPPPVSSEDAGESDETVMIPAAVAESLPVAGTPGPAVEPDAVPSAEGAVPSAEGALNVEPEPLTEPVADTAEPGHGVPAFETDSSLPNFEDDAEAPFPSPTDELPPSSPPTKKESEEEASKPALTTGDMDLDEDMDGLGEVLRSGESE